MSTPRAVCSHHYDVVHTLNTQEGMWNTQKTLVAIAILFCGWMGTTVHNMSSQINVIEYRVQAMCEEYDHVSCTVPETDTLLAGGYNGS